MTATTNTASIETTVEAVAETIVTTTPTVEVAATPEVATPVVAAKKADATFTFAGVSTLAGEVKVRFANDQMRVKVLAKNGHTDINLIELPSAMTKEEAIAHLIGIDFDAGNELIAAALHDAVEARAVAPEKEPKAPKVVKEKVAKAPKVVKEKVAKVKAEKPTLEGIAAKGKAKIATAAEVAAVTAADAALDDAPF